MGEGYHNFHHQFPMDYRNAFLWYQYDPTKWFIAGCAKLGFASQLRVFPSNEISKGRLAMKLKELKCLQDALNWPTPVETLPVVSWATCTSALHFPVYFSCFKVLNLATYTVQEESKSRPLILLSGFIHDVSSFMDQHPGGRHYLTANSGRDVTALFFGGVYRHSNAAHNVCNLCFSYPFIIAN